MHRYPYNHNENLVQLLYWDFHLASQPTYLMRQLILELKLLYQIHKIYYLSIQVHL